MSKESICKDTRIKMEKVVAHLQEELKGLRTGRANTGLVENIKVEYYETLTPLKQLAIISTPDAQSLMIKPYDASIISGIEKAILQSDLGLTPAVEGKLLRITIPPLNEERRKKLSVHAKESGEKDKVALRNVRHDANKHVDNEEKQGILTEDDAKRTKEDIQKTIHEFEGKLNDLVKKKVDEIMKV
ncbi:MAG: ribosome recycling factor [Planctomycetes bacterium RIFCSPHIGHO2_02_FULL_38_41]|nr:MAG: ribosome recycling factor [Planctomycetes bacterium RIFCSPHIGHO2_02_FULL_38_41]OHB97888.1 MAG: ribosome recycling factor [Planctomycetes bacterium RIFCSPLOWO2_12_38_17]OHB99852.1 MAG: ribosome recycling factor [Planctomycetes bacterium RIFCSPHIGHO2_12_39_6]